METSTRKAEQRKQAEQREEARTGQQIAEQVAKYLIRQNLTFSTMESCTAGLLASMVTDTEGTSAVFKGGYVTYTNEAKIAMGVDPAIIEQAGVYSSECAQAMAKTVQKAFGTDLAVGITGSTGNVDPNNADSVQGEVYYCILVKGKVHTFTLQIDVKGKTRHEIKEIYAADVFEKLAFLLEI